MQTPDTHNLRAVADVFFDGRMPSRENFLAPGQIPDELHAIGW
jgi:hypothetical protein